MDKLLKESSSTTKPVGIYEWFVDLIHSIATARMLSQKANVNGSLIEGLCLYVSIIDGFLRLSIIYTRTQKSPNHTYSIEKKLIRQDDNENTYSEKEIYKLALKEEIIQKDIYDKLIEMYNFRNKVVHRFSISNVSYSEVAKACETYEHIYNKIFNILEVLEYGNKGRPSLNKNEKETIFKKINSKILGEP